MPVVTLPDGSRRTVADGSTAADVARQIGPRLADAAIGARIDGKTVDLFCPITSDCTLEIITPKAENPEALRVMRHSSAHVMAEAICRLYPQTKLVYGPPVENGFYYDIDLDKKLSIDDFPAIESEMAKIVAEDRPFTRYELSRDKAMTKLKAEGNPYKVDNAERAVGNSLSFYVTGPEPGKYWEDLCMGTHVPSTKKIGAYKLLSVAGAFWHGDATKQQLQRIYGTAFPTKKDLDSYLNQIEEARQRDHRKIGQELNLFTIDPMVGSGMVLWKPKGALIRLLLENHLREKLREQGYQPVFTPHIGRLELYRTSGHFPYYRDAQFPPLYESDTSRILNQLWIACYERGDTRTVSPEENKLLDELKIANPRIWKELHGESDQPDAKRFIPAPGHQQHNLDLIREHLKVEDGFLLKPMNCPMHAMIYKSEPRSYRDLPVRLAEFGTVYRYEQSGELNGMTRVRGFTQDDAHIFCTPDQLKGELLGCLKLTRYVLDMLGLKDYRVRIGLHDPSQPKYLKNPEGWARSEQALREVVAEVGMSATEEKGEAAFYGPKIDFVVKDCIGREWQLGTVQADYNMGDRFGLEYVGADNKTHRPVVVHRAPFGSMERFIGILIEHFMGAFPFWLSPVQAVVVTISEKADAYAREVAAALTARGLRVELDDSPEKIGPKKHRARQQKVPYILVVGEKESANRMVNVNDRDGKSQNLALDALIEKFMEENQPSRPGATAQQSAE